jgi:DNA-binding MarR family transcriptional regulator
MSDVATGEIYRKIVLLMMRSKRHLARIMEEYEMTVAQGMMLLLFVPGKGSSMQKLSCMMGCDASNTTGLVDRLDNQGMITQTVDPQDRRVKLIELNAKGLERRKLLLKELETAEVADLQKLSVEEQTTLSHLIDKLTAKSKKGD